MHQTVRRHLVTLETWQTDERGYQEYARSIQRLLDLKESDLEPGRLQVESLIPKGVMGEPNSLYQLQNYVAGLSRSGICLTPGGSLDLDRTFQRVNYFTTLAGVRVRNLVQRDLGIEPIDFIAARVPAEALASTLASEDRPGLRCRFCERERATSGLAALPAPGGNAVAALFAGPRLSAGRRAEQFTLLPRPGLPGFLCGCLKTPELHVDGERAAWLNQWHTEREWFEAIHRTRYSNGVIGLYEYFQRSQPESIPGPFRVADEQDWPKLRRFAARRRQLTESDLLIFASDHWNFNVRGFNPGGNHGSFLRISTHSVLMAAGGGVPAGLEIDRPYDSLSLVPTLLSLLGRSPRGNYPGPVIEEITSPRAVHSVIWYR